MKDEGFFSMVHKVRMHILYAVNNGMLPIINWRDFSNPYQREESSNPWDRFFEQPMGMLLEDVYGSAKATFSIDAPFPNKDYTVWDISALSQVMQDILRNITIQYIRPNATMQAYLDQGTTILKGRGRTLACICRGTDYFDTPLIGIAKQPTPQMMIAKAHEMMSRLNCQSIYCATEDERIYHFFEQEFGNGLIPNSQQKYGSNKGKLLMQINREEGYDIYEITRQYYLSMYIVSKCNALVAGAVSGTNAVQMMPNNFEETYVFSLGCVTAADVAEYKKLFDSL